MMKTNVGISLVVDGLMLHLPLRAGASSIPDQGAKISRDLQPKNLNTKQAILLTNSIMILKMVHIQKKKILKSKSSTEGKEH